MGQRAYTTHKPKNMDTPIASSVSAPADAPNSSSISSHAGWSSGRLTALRGSGPAQLWRAHHVLPARHERRGELGAHHDRQHDWRRLQDREFEDRARQHRRDPIDRSLRHVNVASIDRPGKRQLGCHQPGRVDLHKSPLPGKSVPHRPRLL
ncbi:hypothetical protein T492DRAFT_1117380, partial [Pavlovales sp. CCMP2436]